MTVIVNCTLGRVTKVLVQGLEDLEIRRQVAVLRLAKILKII